MAVKKLPAKFMRTRDPDTYFKIVRMASGDKVAINMGSQRQDLEKRRINPEFGSKLGKGPIIGKANELFIGSERDRGKLTRREKREKWRFRHLPRP